MAFAAYVEPVSQVVDFDLSLQPKQDYLYDLLLNTGPDAATIIGYGGARGGAKSGAAQRCAMALAWNTPNTYIMIFRVGWSELVENHIDKIVADFPEMERYWVAGKKRFSLPNGSRIAFRFGQSIKEVRAKTRGQEYQYIFIDQAEECTQAMLTQLRTPNRRTGVSELACKIVYFFNPGGPGTEYLRRIFWLKKYEKHENGARYTFIQAYGWDNFQWFRALPEIHEDEDYFYSLDEQKRLELFITRTDYGLKLMELPESMRMGELWGRFDVFAGQYFAGVWDENKIVLDEETVFALVQPWWTRWMALDWGYRHHSVNLWVASGKVSPKDLKQKLGITAKYPLDVVVYYREYVANMTGEVEFAQGIVARTPTEERKYISRHFCDNFIFGEVRHVENTISELIEPELRAGGLPYPESADKDRVGGWRQLYDGMRRTCMWRSDKRTSEPNNGPLMFISADCPELILAIPVLEADPDNLEDVLKLETKTDDVGDTWRYGWKSALDPKRPPVQVRAELAVEDVTDPTHKAMIMRKFEYAEQQKGYIRNKRRRG